MCFNIKSVWQVTQYEYFFTNQSCYGRFFRFWLFREFVLLILIKNSLIADLLVNVKLGTGTILFYVKLDTGII